MEFSLQAASGALCAPDKLKLELHAFVLLTQLHAGAVGCLLINARIFDRLGGDAMMRACFIINSTYK